MHEHAWSDDELRSFLTTLRAGSGLFAMGDAVDPFERERFLRQAMVRIAPTVERRLLAEVGATVDPRGVAHVTLELLEHNGWHPSHTWLMVSTDPWSFLSDLVVREIRRAYRASMRSRRDDKALKGITEASSRKGLERGEEEPGAS